MITLHFHRQPVEELPEEQFNVNSESCFCTTYRDKFLAVRICARLSPTRDRARYLKRENVNWLLFGTYRVPDS